MRGFSESTSSVRAAAEGKSPTGLPQYSFRLCHITET